jgi:hypothetical protein
MKVTEELPLMLYCDKCGEMGRFHGNDDVEISKHLADSGWWVRRDGEVGLKVLCPTCQIEDLRARAHNAAVSESTHEAVAQSTREADAGVAAPKAEEADTIRARRVEILDASGTAVFVARASKSRGGGQLAIMGPDGSPMLVASASAEGGVLGVANHSGHMIWRAPCGNPECLLGNDQHGGAGAAGA